MTKVYRHTKAHAGIVPAEDMTVEEIERADHGELDALVSLDGELCEVTRKFGVWGSVPNDRGVWRPLDNEHAAALQIAARPLEPPKARQFVANPTNTIGAE